MASVAATRASETWVEGLGLRNNLLKNIKQPLPQSARISPPSLDLPCVPPPLDVQKLNLSPSSHEDANEQILKLLRNQQSGAMKADHKPPASPIATAAPASAASVTGRTSFDAFDANDWRTNVCNGSLKAPELPINQTRNSSGITMTAGLGPAPATVAFTSSGTSRVALLSSSCGSSDLQLQQHTSGTPNLMMQTSLAPAGSQGIGIGTAGSQIRVMRIAPANTQLIQGPNGQGNLQKVQTIELPQEMKHVSIWLDLLILNGSDQLLWFHFHTPFLKYIPGIFPCLDIIHIQKKTVTFGPHKHLLFAYCLKWLLIATSGCYLVARTTHDKVF